MSGGITIKQVTNPDLAKRLADLELKYCNLQNQLYFSGYRKVLPSTFSFFLPQNIHKMCEVNGYTLLSPTGNEVGVAFKLFTDKSVQIDSNINLLNSILILF